MVFGGAKMKKILVAVTPARNEQKYIGAAVRSVISQTYPITKYVVVDDNSTDKTKIYAELEGGDKIIVLPSKRKHQGGYRVYGAPQMTVSQIGINYLDHKVPQWEYLLRNDADIVIPPDYCKTLIQTMEMIPTIVMAGAKWLQTPDDIETTAPFGVRNATHIIRRDFYQYCQARGYTYNNHHGEILLERFAWANGLAAMPIPATVLALRPTTGKSGHYIRKGIEYYQTGRPLLTFLVALRRGLSRERVKVIAGWLHARISSKYEDYFSKTERRVLRMLFYRQHISNLQTRFWFLNRWARKLQGWKTL